MGDLHRFFVVVFSACVVLLAGCNANDAGGASLDDYVARECAFLVDIKDRIARLTRDIATNAKNQTALAGTVDEIASVYEDSIAEGDKLGDPPNGEGVGDDSELKQAARTLVDELRHVADDIGDAKTDAEITAAMSRMNDAIVESTTIAAQWKKDHPTPELDRLKRAYPNCGDE